MGAGMRMRDEITKMVGRFEEFCEATEPVPVAARCAPLNLSIKVYPYVPERA